MEDHEFKDLNPLQIFLLVLVKFGLSTPYDLLLKAGLGPGLTSPALKRLERAALLTSSPGPRNSRRYAITDEGTNLLDRSLNSRKRYWQVGRVDVYGSLPRGIILAWLHSGVDEAYRGAVRAGENLVALGQKKQWEASELRRSMHRLQADILNNDPAADESMLIATAYQWMKALCDAEMFRGQAQAIELIIQALPDFPPAPQMR
jgi:DNA-binding MarR family transcriptional regulator